MSYTISKSDWTPWAIEECLAKQRGEIAASSSHAAEQRFQKWYIATWKTRVQKGSHDLMLQDLILNWYEHKDPLQELQDLIDHTVDLTVDHP